MNSADPLRGLEEWVVALYLVVLDEERVWLELLFTNFYYSLFNLSFFFLSQLLLYIFLIFFIFLKGFVQKGVLRNVET